MKKIKITERQAKILGLSKEPKNTLKITQEQYDRIFGDKILKEGTGVNGGIARNDKAFAKATSSDVINLKPIDEESNGDNFNIRPKNPNIPSSIQDFKKPISISEEESNITSEIDKLILRLYGNSNELSSYWEDNGLSYDKICLELLKKGLIKANGDDYVITKSMGDKDQTKKAIEDVLTPLMTKQEELTEYEGGPDDDTRNPEPKTIKRDYTVKGMNDEMAILEKGGQLFAFHFWDEIENIKKVNAELEYHDNLDNISVKPKQEGADKSIENYVNDASQGITNILNVGEGLKFYQSTEYSPIPDEVNIALIDEQLKAYLLELFNHDGSIVNALSNESGTLNESKLVKHVKDITTPKGEKPKFSPEEIKAKLAYQKQKSKEQDIEADKAREAGKLPYSDKEELEEITAVSSGQFTAGGNFLEPMENEQETTIKRKLEEMTQGSDSVGEYTANALPNIGKDGEFKKGKKPKAFKTPQWAGGDIIGTDDDGGSVNAPSLAENKIYETIAAKTGKSIDEVKRIIKSKNGKA